MLCGLSWRGAGLGWTNYKGKPQLQEEADREGGAALEGRMEMVQCKPGVEMPD